MPKILNVLVGAVALVCLAIWAQWMFSVESMARQWAVAPLGVVGLNNLRGDVGGLFLSTAVFCVLYFRHGAVWLRAAAVSMGCVLLNRLAGAAIDGFDPAIAVSMGVEVVFIAVFLAAATYSSRAPA